MRQFPPYWNFIGVKSDDKAPDDVGTANAQPAPKTPTKLIEESYLVLKKTTADELLGRLLECTPSFFEWVVMELLRAMGYGGERGEGQVTGQPGDGGIDGIIKEDKLGLDIVCIQAKRWHDTVGRPTVQAFVGSMDLHRAKKGIILTTSGFSKEAKEFVDRIEGKKVVLIDGEKLAELMWDHRVGVISTKSYELKELSNDFFDEEE